MPRTLFQLLLYGIVALGAECAAENPRPLLVVRAKTDLANQGKPTVDLVDLERYYVEQLRIHRFDDAFPHATAKLPEIPQTNVYLIELSVDAFRSAVRTYKDAAGGYHDDPVLIVELSVKVQHARSGQMLGTRIVLDEHHFSSEQMKALAPKRAALYASADHLAAYFASEVSQGAFGERLRLSQRPLPLLEQIQLWHIVFGVITLLVVMILVIFLRAALSKERPDFDKRLADAEDIAIQTRGHSDEWYEAIVNRSDEEILAKATKTRRKEAKQRIRAKQIEQEYEYVADYAAEHRQFDRDAVIAKLRKADELQFRLLELAIKKRDEADRRPQERTADVD